MKKYGQIKTSWVQWKVMCTSIDILTHLKRTTSTGYIRFQHSNQLGFQVDFPGNFLSKCQMCLGVKGNTNMEGEFLSRKLSFRLQLCCFPPAHPQDSPSSDQSQAEDPEKRWLFIVDGENGKQTQNLQQVGLCEMQRSLKCRRSFSSSRTWKKALMQRLTTTNSIKLNQYIFAIPSAFVRAKTNMCCETRWPALSASLFNALR